MTTRETILPEAEDEVPSSSDRLIYPGADDGIFFGAPVPPGVRVEQLSSAERLVIVDDVDMAMKRPSEKNPESVRGNILHLVQEARVALSSDHRVGSDIADIVRKVVPEDGDRGEHIRALLQSHLEEFPKEPKGGFNNSRAYVRYAERMNMLLAEERAIYNQSPLDFHPEDPESPGKKLSTILVECADGRNSPHLFLDQADMLTRFATKWLPFGGVMIFPEIPLGQSEQELDAMLDSNPELKAQIYRRLDVVFGASVRRFLRRKNDSDQFSQLHFEFQSHCQEKGFPHHGCGAHGSNFDEAQAETIKNCFLVDRWLKEFCPTKYGEGSFKVYRTVHDTGEGGNVYSGTHMDQKRVSSGYRQKHQSMFDQAAEKFSPPKAKGLAAGVVREYKSNHLSIDTEKHSEQAVRVSNTHYAHTLVGQSVLEISWTDSAENLFAIINKLLGIIDKNFREDGKNSKPAILHFDRLFDRPDISSVLNTVMSKIHADESLQSRLNDGSLQIVTSVTDPHTYVTNFKAAA